jgi:hypothetical protein
MANARGAAIRRGFLDLAETLVAAPERGILVSGRNLAISAPRDESLHEALNRFHPPKAAAVP